MNIRRYWAMPNKWTFKIKPIEEILFKYNVGKHWIDPFAGKFSPAEITNDLNPSMPTKFHLDALEFLKMQKSANGILFDPPYSFRQASECYKKFGLESFKVTRMDYWSNCKNEIARICNLDGIVICCGWNSNGIGTKRGFELLEIIFIAHGGNRNDTILTVEKKIQSVLI